MIRRRHTLALAAAAAALAALAACGTSDSPTETPPDGPTVAANTANQFVPNVITITVGATVTWVFGAVDHNVLFSAAAGKPADIAIVHNTNVSRTFTTAGTFAYLCSLHAGMTGSVIVQ